MATIYINKNSSFKAINKQLSKLKKEYVFSATKVKGKWRCTSKQELKREDLKILNAKFWLVVIFTFGIGLAFETVRDWQQSMQIKRKIKLVEIEKGTSLEKIRTIEKLVGIGEKKEGAAGEQQTAALILPMNELDHPKKVSRALKPIQTNLKNKLLEILENECNFLETSKYVVPLKAKDTKTSQPCDVQERLKRFLDANNKFKILLLSGTAGSGKTLLCQSFARELLKNDDEAESSEYLPIFVSLLQLKNPYETAIEETLTGLGIEDPREIEHLKKTKILWIFDSYNEILFKETRNKILLKNLYGTNNFGRWPNSKFIFTVRKDFCSDEYFHPVVGDLESVQLEDFSQADVLKCLENFAKIKKISGKKFHEYNSLINYLFSDKQLISSITNPYLLKFILDSLSMLKELDLTTDVDDWLSEGKKALQQSIMQAHLLKSFTLISRYLKDPSIRLETVQNFCTRTAYSMYRSGKDSLSITEFWQEAHIKDEEKHKMRVFRIFCMDCSSSTYKFENKIYNNLLAVAEKKESYPIFWQK